MAQLKDLLVSGAARFLNGLNVNGDLTIAGNLLPAKNETYNIGDSSHRWRQTQTKYLSVGAGDISSSGYEAVISGDFHTTGYSLFDDYVQIGGTRPASYTLYVNGPSNFTNYLYINRGTTNAASLLWNKSGSYYSGIGYGGTVNENYLGPCNSDGTWINANTEAWNFRGLVKITNYGNTVLMGSQNSGWIHMTANKSFYINPSVHVDGTVYIYNEGASDSYLTNGQLVLRRTSTTAGNLPAEISLQARDSTLGTVSYATIAAYSDHGSSSYGSNLVLSSGGNTLIQAGDGTYGGYTNLIGTGTNQGENLYLTADDTIQLCASADTSNRKLIWDGTTFYPSISNAFANGGTGNYWAVERTQWLETNRSGSGLDGGISLYAGERSNYAIYFRQTSNQGTHGFVTADWAMYFTMDRTANRGWIFRNIGTGNVASINNAGHMHLNGRLSLASNWRSLDANQTASSTTKLYFGDHSHDKIDSGTYYIPWFGGRESVNGHGYGNTWTSGLYISGNDTNADQVGYYLATCWDDAAAPAQYWSFTRSGLMGMGTLTPSYKLHVMGDIYADGGWLRTSGVAGWYNNTYNGGWYMTDSNFIRNFNSKAVSINVASNNAWGIGSHRLAAVFKGNSHVSILLSTNSLGYGLCVNNDGNWYLGKRTTSSETSTSGDSYILYGSTSHMSPYSTNAIDLGLSNHRWRSGHIYRDFNIYGNESTGDESHIRFNASDNTQRAIITFNGNADNTFKSSTHLKIATSYGDIRLAPANGNVNIGDGNCSLTWRKADNGSTTGGLESGIYFSTPGRESVVFANMYTHTGWIFVNGIRPSNKTNWNALGITPAMQIHHNAIYINRPVRDADTADYNLYVNGTSYLNGALTVNGNIYVNQTSGAGTGISLYSTGSPATSYGIMFATTSNYGTHGYVTGDWATYFTMDTNGNSTPNRGWIFRNTDTYGNVASIDSAGNAAFSQYIQFSNGAHVATNRSTDYHHGYTFNIGDNSNNIGIYSGSGGECGAVIVSPEGCLIYNSSDCGYNLDIHDKDLGADLTSSSTRTFCITQNGYYAWSRGGFQKNGSSDNYVLLGGGGHALISSLSVTNADTLDGYHESSFLRYSGWWNSDSSQNVNDASGMVFAYSNHGLPGPWGIVTTFDYSKNSEYRHQIYGDGWNNEMYFRTCSFDRGGWNAWKHLLDDSNYAGILDGRYVNVTGDTMTGSLTNNARMYCNEWIQFNGTTGLYWPNGNGAHFYPNTASSYGTFMMQGTRGGYFGYLIGDSTGYMHVMDNGNDKGLYQQDQGMWMFYYNKANSSVSLRTSSIWWGSAVNIQGGLYVNGGNQYVSGYIQSGTRIICGYDSGVSGSVSCSNWFRSSGNTGWYNDSYGGGWYMTDSTWMRSYADKPIYTAGGINSPHGHNLLVGGNEFNFIPDNYNNAIWFNYQSWSRNSSSTVSSYYFGNGHSDWGTTHIYAGAVHNAVWNDYAECREADTEEPGRVLFEKGDDTLELTNQRLQAFAGVSSDTYGVIQGETKKAKTPLAVAGRVLVYPYQNRNNYKPGDCVCAAPGGTVDIMTREEIIQYPDRIVGTVSCVPNYEEWGTGKVKVNGRIWIKVC